MNASTDHAAIRGIVAAALKGLHDRDAAAITALYAPDAVFISPPLSHKVDPAARRWLGTWQGPVEREAKELGLAASGDLAVWYGFFHTSATTSGGENAAWWSERPSFSAAPATAGGSSRSTPPCHSGWTGAFLAATDLTPVSSE